MGISWKNVRNGGEVMVEAMLFMLGFTGVVSIYEIAKTSKSSKSNAIKRDAMKIGRKHK